MSNIHDVFKDDDVNGTIVGGDYVCGYLFYGDKRAHVKQLYAKSEAELKEKAISLKQEILEDNKEIRHWLFPDNDAWSVKILI